MKADAAAEVAFGFAVAEYRGGLGGRYLRELPNMMNSSAGSRPGFVSAIIEAA